jgi:RNA polymerase sigma factor (TIGR02999 family)
MEDESERSDAESPEEKESLDDLFNATYEELRRLAWAVKRKDSSLTLNPTALVHEVWLKLAKSPPFATTSRMHFIRIAARAMRQVLVDAARHRNAHKRGGEVIFVTLDGSIGGAATSLEDLLALNDALEELERLDPLQVTIVECKFFADLNVSEIAEMLGVSESTVQRKWRKARAWLQFKLGQKR